MTKIFFLAAMSLFTISIARAQNPQPLKKVLELVMPKTVDDDMPGTRGASVVWHPVEKKYYASFAGNGGYPMAVFDVNGKRISEDDLTTLVDTRGLWYDPVLKKVCGNGYDDKGWFSYVLDKKGIPYDGDVLIDQMHQPDPQSVGVYNTGSKRVLFVNKSQVFMYDAKGNKVDSVMIHWSRKKINGPADDEDKAKQPVDFNYTSLVYTGIKGQELGFLNITNKEIELYDITTGYQTKRLALPETAVVEALFNFAYANGTYWLFDIDMRKWIGYK